MRISNNRSMAVTGRGGRPRERSSTISNLESPYDVTAEDWHAHWHDEDEAQRLKRIKRLDRYNVPRDFATVGYRGLHQNKIEYAAADRERINRHRAAFASRNAHKADNQTSSRLFRTAKPEVRLPATSAAPLTIEVNPSPAVSGPTAIPPHLRDLPRYSATHDVRPDVKREDPTNHAQASGSGTAASTVESDQDSPPSATSCYGDKPCLASTVPMTVSAVKEGHALIQDEQLQHTLPNVGSLSLSTLQETDDVCPICEGPYTHDDPGLSTPCCGLLIHQLCNFEAFEEHGECHGCHGDQVAADMPEPESPSATDDYIRHFDTKPQSFSTSSLKSEQVGASSTSTSSAIMTLSEYVESQAEPRSATSSLAADASSASFSWVSSVEDGDIDKDDTSLSEEPTGTFTTTPDSLQARVASASKEETQSMPFEAWNHTQPCSSNLPSDQPTTAEAMEILDGATEHLIDAYLEFGMCVDNEFKDGILERIVIAFEGKVDQPW